MPRAVQWTSEFRRVAALPRRTWSDEEGEQLAAALTAVLRTPEGQQCLRPVQAIALLELVECRGFLGMIRVGGGKTLVSALAGTVLESERPMVLLPAKLVEKTRREFEQLRLHWRLPEHVAVVSYELLGHPSSGATLDADGRVTVPELLERYQPDLIVADEGHRLKRETAASTKRVRRYLKTHPTCVFAPMSGTFATRTILDYGHLAVRALGEGAPLPRPRNQMEDWAKALDDEPSIDVGALASLPGPDPRRAYRARLVETKGVVVFDRPYRDQPLTIDPLPLTAPAVVEEALDRLRNHWELPDGTELVEALELWRALRQVALGFYLRWDPAPPSWWLEPRKEWFAACRHIVGSNRRNLDSPKPVVEAIDTGLYPEAAPALAAWREVRDRYEPTTVAVWLHPFAAEAAAAWLEADGICWAEHSDFAERVAELAGVPYFAAEGRDANGIYVEDASGPIVASVQSCSEGMNLQHKWSRNLITSPPSNGKIAEQLIGRTHRDGQRRPVSIEWFRTCDEHYDAYARALNNARYVEATTGLTQKLMEHA